VVAGAAIALSLAGGARAATPFTLDPDGDTPSVAVDAGGTGHFAWLSEPSGGVQTVVYCDVPRGGSACAHRQSFDLPGPNSPPVNGASAALVVLVPGTATVLLVVPRYVDNDTLLWRSDDGGASFSGPVTIATRTGTHGSDYRNAVLGPGNVISMGFDNPSVYFQAAPLAGPPGSAELEFPPPPSGVLVYNVETAIDNGIPIVAGWNIPGAGQHNQVGFYRWSGAGDINSAATWTGPTIVGEGDETSLVSGPGGVFLFSRGYRSGQDFSSQPQVQKFNGTTFGAPVSFGTTGDDQLDAVEPSADFLIVATRHRGTSGEPVHIEVSRDGGATFTGFDVAPAISPFPLRVGAAPDGTGFVAYHENGTLSAVAFDASSPPPVLGQSVTVARASGTVLVKLKGQSFKPLTADRGIPVGSLVDTRRGVVSLTSAVNTRGATQSGSFTAGIFQVLQGRRSRGLTNLRLSGSGFARCAGAGKASAARRRLSRRVVRKLRANVKGRFRTTGRYASATVRGTRWDMTDRCDGTLTRVRRGVVVVDDLRRHRRVTVRAGKSYLARAR
jgi:hypothetical protein